MKCDLTPGKSNVSVTLLYDYAYPDDELLDVTLPEVTMLLGFDPALELELGA